MELWMSATTANEDFASLFADVRDIVEPAFNAHFMDRHYGRGLVEVHYSALLQLPMHQIAGETKRYVRATHSAELKTRVKVPFECGEAMLVQQLARSMSRSWSKLERLRIPEFDHNAFISDFDELARMQGWLSVRDIRPERPRHC